MNKNITSRVLNMEEKRRIEKIIFADIEKAKMDFQNLKNTKRTTLENSILANPPSEAVKLFNEYKLAKETEARSEKQLKNIGFYPKHDYHDKKPTLAVNNYGEVPKALETFDKAQENKIEKLDAIKRNYIIKLFAGGEEAQEIFKALAEELKAILK